MAIEIYNDYHTGQIIAGDISGIKDEEDGTFFVNQTYGPHMLAMIIENYGRLYLVNEHKEVFKSYPDSRCVIFYEKYEYNS